METDPNAQGQDGTGSPDNGQSQESQVFAGVQKRIDELVGQNKDMERRFQDAIQGKDQQISDLTRILLEQQQNRQTPNVPEVEVNPEIAAQVRALTQPIFKQYDDQLQQAHRTIAQMQYQQTAQQYPPEVQQRASALLQQWSREGKTGWSMPDALVMAAYQMGVPPPTAKPQPNRAANGQFTGPLNEHAAPPTAAPPNTSAIPANIDDLPLDKQIELYGKSLGDKIF